MSSRPDDDTVCLACVAGGDEGGGVIRVVQNLLEALPRRGVRPVALTLTGGRLADALRRAGHAVRVLDLPPAPGLHGGTLSKIAQLARNTRHARRHAGVVAEAVREAAGGRRVAVQFVGPHLLPLVGRAGRRLGVGGLWDMPNTLSPSAGMGFNRWFYRRGCRRYGVLPLANSRFTARSLVPDFAGDSDAVRVVYPMTDERRFDPDRPELAGVRGEVRRELGVPAGAVLLGLIARLVPEKGAAHAVRALAEAPSRLHLLVAGDGPPAFRAEVERLIEGLNVRDRVHLLAATDAPERLWPACDAGLNARVDAEPYGLSVAEAMMMARPVLVHAHGGPAETVADGATGWHVPASPPDRLAGALAAGMRRVADDADDADADRLAGMGRAAREEALGRLSSRAIAGRYADLVERQAGVARLAHDVGGG